MLLHSRLKLAAWAALLCLTAVSGVQAQNTAPVPSTFEIVSPADGNPASLINSDYTVNKRIFFGGDLHYYAANNNSGFLGFTNPADPNASSIARGNMSGSRLTLGSTEAGYDNAFPSEGISYVASLGTVSSGWPTNSFDYDDLGQNTTQPDYSGENGFIAINEGDTLEINITGFIDPNNRMVQGEYGAGTGDGDYTGRNFKSQDGNESSGNDGANNVTYSAQNLPEGASFVGTRLRWVPTFIQGDGTYDNSVRGGRYFVDANISDGDTGSELADGSVDVTDDVNFVGVGKGELRDSLYVIYFRTTDDGSPAKSAIDSLFILVNDSIPNPKPRFTTREMLIIDSLDVQVNHEYDYLAGATDTVFNVWEGDSVVITFYAEDQDAAQGEVNDTIAFGMLWNDSILDVPKGGTTSGPLAGFNQFIFRSGTVDTLVADTSSTLSAGSATSFRVKLQIPYNLATSSEKVDSMVVMVSDGASIVADTFGLKVRNTNRPPVWDADTTDLPSDSLLVFAPSSVLELSDSTQSVGAITINNNQTDSTYFGSYVYDPDQLVGDNQGVPITFSAGTGHKGALNENTGLNVYTPSENDTITYSFTMTATDSYTDDPGATDRLISFRIAPVVTITEVEPANGAIGDEFTIYGSGFGLYDNNGVDSSRVQFYAYSGGKRQNIDADVISWSRDKIVAAVPAGVPASGLDQLNQYVIPDTIIVRSAIYGGYDTYPFTVEVDSTRLFQNLEVVNITTTSAVVRYSTSLASIDSVVVASQSDTLDIHSANFTLPTFVEDNNGSLTQIRSSVQVFKETSSQADGTHVIQITDLTPSTLYKFFIATSNGVYAADSLRNTGGPYRPNKIDINDRTNNSLLDAFHFRTLPAGGVSGDLYTVLGRAYYIGGAAEGALVTLRLVDSDSPSDTSMPLVATVDSDSTYLFNLGNLRNSDGTAFDHSGGDYMLFEFDGSEVGYEEYDTTRSEAVGDTLMEIRPVKLVQPVNYKMELLTGLNLVGPPLRQFKGGIETAHDFLAEIQGGAPSITRYETGTGSQQTITRSIKGNYIGADDFDIEINEGYFVRVGTKTSVNFEGRVYTNALPTVTFEGAGLYFISLPAQDNDIYYSWDAEQILESVANSKVIYRFNPELQSYENYTRYGTSYVGTNFDFEVGEGYILNLSGPASWDPSGPGTLLAGGTSQRDGENTRNIVVDISSDQQAEPGSVMVTNITSSASVFTWLAGDGRNPGRVRISKADGSGGEIVVSATPGKLGYGMGHAQVTGLEPGTEYSFTVEGNDGLPLGRRAAGSFTTAAVGAAYDPYTLFGRLVDPAGEVLDGVLITVRLSRSDGSRRSTVLSAVSDERGYWLVNLANLKDEATGEIYYWNEGDRIEMTVIGGTFRKAFDTEVVAGSPHNVALDLDQDSETDQSADRSPSQVVLPKAYALSQNFPNPFNPSTTIQFSIPESGGMVKVRLEVFNLRGQTVSTLVDSELQAGEHKVEWNGTDNAGRKVPSGVYFYRLSTPAYKATRKMVILK